MQDIPRISTERTILTILKPESAVLLLNYYVENRAHLAPWEPAREESYYSLGACKDRLTNAYTGYFQKRCVNFSILNPNESELMGMCNFTNIIRGPFQACYMGYSIACKHEAKGLMNEAAQSAIRFMFEEIGLHRIMANYMPHNDRSAKLLKNLGFEKEGYAKSYLKIAGQWQDHVLTSLIDPSPAK
jgi:ribosomal-protein-alanine N-acetyltransferase